MFKAYINMWKNTFNCKGRITKEEYWISHASQILVILIVAGILFVDWLNPYFWYGLSRLGRFSCFVIIFIHIFPNVSMFIRRLRDSGYFDTDKKQE